MTGTDARRLRLRAHGLDPVLPLAPAGVVARGVALQGQDLSPVLRAIAIRSEAATTVDSVRAAFDRGELIRAWTQRGTLFVTTPESHADLAALTAERTIRASSTRRAQLGLDDAVVVRAESVLREILAGGGVTRSRLMRAWEEAGVDPSGQRGYHLIFLLSLRGAVHWGPFDGAAPTEQQLVATSATGDVDPSAALERVARGYLRSHGPVLLDDLAWWLGIPKARTRPTLAALGEDLVDIEVDGARYLVLAETLEPPPPDQEGGVLLVPGFDEIYIGYQQRTLVASPTTQRALVPGGNGVFRPAVLVDGRIVGSWRRAPRTGEPVVELTEPVTARIRRRIDAAAAAWPHG